MHYRETIIEDDKTLDDSGSVSIPINVIDPITELLLKFKVTNTSGVSSDVPPEMSVDKIEITDGGKVYMALTGYEAVAAACYDKGFWPPHWYIENGGSSQRISIPLQFGRYVGDPDFAFDPTKLKNPALKFTFSKESDHEASSLRLGVLAKIMEGVPGPSKCLFYRGVEAFTSTTGVHVVDLLTDLPYRRLLVRAYLYGSTLDAILSHLKLDCDVGRLIVFDHDAAEWQDILRAFSGEFDIRKFDVFEGGTIDYKNCHMSGRTMALGSCGTPDRFGMFWASGADYYSLAVYDGAGSWSADCNVQTKITGEFPHNVYCYQFGHQDKPDTWFRASQYKDIDLKLTQGVAGAAVSVLLQQPVSLP